MRDDTPKYVIELAKELRKEPTKAENALWKVLRNGQLSGFKFKRQQYFGRYIADFYCRRAELIIEIDGEIHNQKERKELDKIRENELTARGLKILRFTNNQVLKDIEYVKAAIIKAIDENKET